MTLPATDVFDNTGGASVALTTYSANWSYVYGTFSVDHTTDRCLSGTGGQANIARWNADTFNVNQYSQAVLTVAASNFAGVSVRGQSGAATGYTVMTDGSAGETYIERTIAGATSTVVQIPTLAWVTGDVMRVEVSGTGATVTIVVKKNGSTVHTEGDTHADRITTAGYAGVAGYGDNSISLTGVDDWEGGDLTAIQSQATRSMHQYRMRHAA